jgi:hypothetical protein
MKNLVKHLGARDEKYWKPALEKLEGMGEAGTPAFYYAMTWSLQNIRARACAVASKWKKSEAMIPGLLEALQRYEEDKDPSETAIRRWAARTLGDLVNRFTLDNLQVRVDKDKDIGVAVLLARGILRHGEKTSVELLIEGMKAEEGQVAGWAAEAFAECIPKSGLKAGGFAEKPLEERAKIAGEMEGWWSKNANTLKMARAQRITDPTPVTPEIRVFKPSDEPISPEDEDEVGLNIRDAEEALAAGDFRKAAGRFRAAYSEFGKGKDLKLAIRWLEAMRQCGPDNADKAYKNLRDTLIPRDPTNVDLWVTAARSALASGGETGKRWARDCAEMVLVLDPDSQAGADLKKEIG